MKTKMSTFQNYLILAILLLIPSEFFLRIISPDITILLDIIEQSDDSRGYILRSNSSTNYGGLHEEIPVRISWDVNEDGIRSNRSTPAPSNKFRVATYGDSETFGWGVPFTSTFQQIMESNDPVVEVLNFGVPGYNAEHVAEHVEITFDEYKPDLLVYLFHKNDFDSTIQLNPNFSWSYLYI